MMRFLFQSAARKIFSVSGGGFPLMGRISAPASACAAAGAVCGIAFLPYSSSSCASSTKTEDAYTRYVYICIFSGQINNKT